MLNLTQENGNYNHNTPTEEQKSHNNSYIFGKLSWRPRTADYSKAAVFALGSLYNYSYACFDNDDNDYSKIA